MSRSSTIDRRFIPIPTQYQIYDSYAIDPKWQTRFTTIWTSVLAFSFLCSIPYIIRSIRNGRLYAGLAITESLEPLTVRQSDSDIGSVTSGATLQRGETGDQKSFPARWILGVQAMIQSITLWTIPMPNLRFWKSQVGDCCRRAYFTLGIAQAVLVMGYLAAVVACFVVGAKLTENSNRPGFIALSQLPLIVLLSLKSPLPLPIFLPSLSYEHYNFLHRWTGRTLFVTATVHGGMWINQFIKNGEYDQISSDKSKRGILAYALMGMVVITSLKPVRRKCYQLFWIAHVVFFVGFFAAISYHTPYSRPWIYPCVAIYGYDLFVRMLRYRIKDATLIPVDETMTMIHIPDCDAGWLPTQHVFLRVMRGSGVFESHPFTITNAPSTPLSASPRGIILYAKVAGDWTKKVHSIASKGDNITETDDEAERERFLKGDNNQSEGEKITHGQQGLGMGVSVGLDHPGTRVQVMLDGPYGGLKLDLGEHENVLLVGGGSGITFILGGIEEALRVRAKGKGPKKVDVAWVVRDMSTITALSPTLLYLHKLATRLSVDLTYNLYLSDPPNPLPTVSVPGILPPSTTLSPFRPEVAQLVREALPLTTPRSIVGDDHLVQTVHSDDVGESGSGGLAVIACGPEGIVSEAKNAVACLSVAERIRAGGIGFHGECYAL
ncbi:hypothetical protein IAT40_006423 [Kwoniella sp. CBS 6097]